jgi:subtilisin family serine protease
LIGDPSIAYARRRGYGPSPYVNRLLDKIASDYGLQRRDGWQISSLGIYCEVYELGPGQEHAEVLRRVSADPRVESVQAMIVFETEGIHYDDPYFSMQPAIVDLAIDGAHERATGRGVTVAVIDSLVDDRHPEFRGRVPVRRDLVSGHKLVGRAEVHGTAIAGIIASTANNAEGIVGVAPDAEIVSLRACWTVNESTGRAMCSTFSLAQSLEMALSIGVDVINLSLSGPYDPLLARLIDVAILDGVIVVAALPDESRGSGSFPASHPGVIAAGSLKPDVWTVPNALTAPGSEVMSTVPDASYGFFTGNSMSAAFISGIAALMVERRPGIKAPEVLSLLTETSTVQSVNACLAVSRLSAGSNCADVSVNLIRGREAISRTLR